MLDCATYSVLPVQKAMQIQDVELKKLKPWEKNPRINDHAIDTVVKSITTFGFNVPILCDPDLTIIAGHTRWKAAKKLKMKTVRRTLET